MNVARLSADAQAHVAERWPELTFGLVNAVAIVADLVIVWTGHESISAHTWDQDAIHPTIPAAAMFFSPYIGWLLRKSWPALLMFGVEWGHLFLHL